MQSRQILDTIRKKILAAGRDNRFREAAYIFVVNGLEYYLTKLGEKRHVNGREFSYGLAEFAHKQFGPMAFHVLTSWGVSSTGDFGTLVYNLIDIGLMSRRPEDSLDDFMGVFDLRAHLESLDCFTIDRKYIHDVRGA